MGIAAPGRGFRSRLSRIFTAVAASVALIAAPVLVAAPANAADGDYIGIESDGVWPDKTLAVMTAGVPYSDSLTSPVAYDSRYAGLTATNAPRWLAFSFTSIYEIRVSGTPEAGSFDFTLRVDAESSTTLRFAGTVQDAKTATTTTVTAPAIAPYSSIPLSAVIAPASGPTGSVQFGIGGANFTGNLTGSSTSASAAVDASKSGSTLTTTATYSGDDDYAASSGTASTFIYGSGTVGGTVRVDSVAVSGAVVDLLDGTTQAVVETKTVAADGKFSFDRTISTVEDATAKYVLRATLPAGTGLATGTQLFYATADPAASASSFTDALKTGPVEWIGADYDFHYFFVPTWSDQTLATPRHNAAYSDSVTASGSTAISYSVSAGSLPAGLGINTSTGAITGTPSAEAAYNFTVKAVNSYGFVTKAFSGTVLPAGVPPTWTDKVLGDLQVGAAFSDALAATGDPTIGYAVTHGVLPAGLALDTTTGAITGTPTSAGAFDFTITATNDYGHVDQRFTGTVTAAPTIELALDFRAGTPITDASSTISADGLKVGSTYTLYMHSTPVLLYTGIVGAGGAFNWNIALPANTPPGAHKLILTGIAPDGSTMTAEAWFTLGANGKVLAISYTGPTALAFTGADDPALPLGAAGSLLLFGVLALVVAHRRHRA